MEQLPPSSPTGLLPAFRPEQGNYSREGEDEVRGAKKPQSNKNKPIDPLSSPPGPPIPRHIGNEGEDEKLPPLRTFYPTPLPSSSVGDRPSSPDQHQQRHSTNSPNNITQAFASAAAQSKSFNVRSPLSAVAMVRLPKNGTTISIGRSSKSCQVSLSKSKLISRVHLKTRFDSDSNMVIVECLGWNGVTVVVPTYTAEQLEELDLSRGYPTAEGQSDYEIVKGQTIHVEYVPGITLDIRGERALIEVVDDDVNDETEDEVHEVENPGGGNHDNNISSSPVAKLVSASDMNTADQASKENTNPASFNANAQEVEIEAEPNPEVAPAPAPEPEQVQEKAAEEPERNDEDIHQDEKESELEKAIIPSKEQPDEKTPELVKRPLEEVDVNHQQPITKKPKTAEPTPDPEGEEDVEEKPIKDLDQIKHIVANHLAFSRLASTPVSIVQKSNSMLGKLSKNQLRDIMQNIKCVGIIPRAGKDAAGKLLEEEYYYAPEQDDDDHRKMMVQQTRGGGLRSCRKKHKQYFWKKPAK